MGGPNKKAYFFLGGGGLYWGPPIQGNYHLCAQAESSLIANFTASLEQSFCDKRHYLDFDHTYIYISIYIYIHMDIDTQMYFYTNMATRVSYGAHANSSVEPCSLNVQCQPPKHLLRCTHHMQQRNTKSKAAKHRDM